MWLELGRRLSMILLIVAVATDFAVPAVAAGFTSARANRRHPHTELRCALAQLLDCGDNAPELTGDGFGDNFERWIPDLLHGYGRVDGGDFDLAASEVLHDHVAR